MNNNREQLISELTNDLTPIIGAGRIMGMVVLWLLASFILVSSIMYMVDPFRETSAQQLINHPQFFIESFIGMLAIIFLTIVGFRLGIPSNDSLIKLALPALSVLVIWILFYIAGLWFPALEPSMEGKRTVLCHIETFIYGCMPLALGLFMIRKLWPLYTMLTGLIIGLAAGAIPALIMQFACLYDPHHIISHHIVPGLILGVVGALAGHFTLSKKPTL